MRRLHFTLFAVLLLAVPATRGAETEGKRPSEKRVREFLTATHATSGSLDDLLDILGGRLGLAREATHATGTGQSEMIARHFSDEDLKELGAFFRTSTGRHWIAVAPQFAAEARTKLEARTAQYIAASKQRDLEHRTRNGFRGVGFALKAYFAAEKSYPAASSAAELAAQLVPKYIAAVPQQDAWGNLVRYRVSDDKQHYWLSSAGPDGVFATTDDLDKSDDIVFQDGTFIHGGDPISYQLPASKTGVAQSPKMKMIRELLRVTEAQETTADGVIDVIGSRLSLGIAPEETRGEAREGPEMVRITEDVQAPLYDRLFTAAQLRRIVAFFKTEPGEHLVEAARRIAAETRVSLRTKAAARP